MPSLRRRNLRLIRGTCICLSISTNLDKFEGKSVNLWRQIKDVPNKKRELAFALSRFLFHQSRAPHAWFIGFFPLFLDVYGTIVAIVSYYYIMMQQHFYEIGISFNVSVFYVIKTALFFKELSFDALPGNL